MANKWGWLKGTKLAGQDEHPLAPDTSPAGISADKLILSHTLQYSKAFSPSAVGESLNYSFTRCHYYKYANTNS